MYVPIDATDIVNAKLAQAYYRLKEQFDLK